MRTVLHSTQHQPDRSATLKKRISHLSWTLSRGRGKFQNSRTEQRRPRPVCRSRECVFLSVCRPVLCSDVWMCNNNNETPRRSDTGPTLRSYVSTRSPIYACCVTDVVRLMLGALISSAPRSRCSMFDVRVSRCWSVGGARSKEQERAFAHRNGSGSRDESNRYDMGFSIFITFIHPFFFFTTYIANLKASS